MERAVCEQCGEFQPGDWIPGHLCAACGGVVRREVRCAWCAQWIPASRFCRLCGCEVVGPELYGPARMLKSAGVDRFSLARRLSELDPEQTANLGRIYNARLAVVARRVDELRLCERHLLQRTFSRRVDEELVARLPMEEGEFAALDAPPAQGLPEILERSPLAIARALASLALLRLGRFEGAYTACDALRSDDPELALEAAAAFAHWRVRLCPYSIDERALRKVAAAVPRGSPLRPWAAVASVLVRHGDYGVADPDMPEWVLEELRAGVGSRDADLRFACAMALGEGEIVVRGLDSTDGQQQLVARKFLAIHRSPALAPLLLEGSEEIRTEILEWLRPPLPEALVEPVLHAIERAGPETRAQGVRLLQPTLTEPVVERLVRIALRARDLKMFEELLRSERLPGGQAAVRAIIRAGLFEPLYDPLSSAAELIDFTDEALSRLAAQGGAAVVEKLVSLAGNQLDRAGWNENAVVFVARILFAGPAEVRRRAYRVLEEHHQPDRDWLGTSAMRELFGSPAGFLKAVLPLLEDEETAPLCVGLLESHWAEMPPALAGDRPLLKRFIDVLGKLAAFPGVEKCRREAARLLAKLAVNFPDVALPAVAALLRENGTEWDYRDIPGDLLEEYGALVRRIGRDRSLAGELASGLAALFPRASNDERFLPATRLLANLEEDFPELRPSTGERIEAAAESEPEPPPKAPPEVLDHTEMLSDTPLKTLAQYVGFMKAMSAAADPMAVFARYGMDQDSFVDCISRWGEVLSSNDDLAVRFGELMAAEGSDEASASG